MNIHQRSFFPLLSCRGECCLKSYLASWRPDVEHSDTCPGPPRCPSCWGLGGRASRGGLPCRALIPVTRAGQRSETHETGVAAPLRSAPRYSTLLRSTSVSRQVRGWCRGLRRNPLMSTTSSSSRVLSTCFRNLCPMPTLACAPSISPGRSATEIWRRSPYSIVPMFGLIVVTAQQTTLFIRGAAFRELSH